MLLFKLCTRSFFLYLARRQALRRILMGYICHKFIPLLSAAYFHSVISLYWCCFIPRVACFNSVISFCWYYITSVTCFNSVISFWLYYIITSVTCFNSVMSLRLYNTAIITCFNSVISFCWYYIITGITCFNLL